MFIEEPALESIYHLVDSLLENLNPDIASKEKQEFRKILLIFKRDPANQADSFQKQMLNFIQNLIKLSAVPNPFHVFSSFKKYLSNYMLNLKNSNNNESNLDINHENENEACINSFLFRESQKRSTKDFHKTLQELKLLRNTNLDLERKKDEYDRIINQFNDEIIYLNYAKEKIDSILTDDLTINKYDEIDQKEVEDLMFLIDQINNELKSGNTTT